MRSKKNQFLKYKMSYQETTKPAVSSNSYSSSSVQDMVQVNTMTTIHLINKLNTFTTPYLKSNHQPGEEEYKKLENDIKTLLISGKWVTLGKWVTDDSSCIRIEKKEKE